MVESAESILLKYWGYDNFRPGQKDIVDQIHDGKDVLVLLPTGGGKSICFQVPALLKSGLTLVISPLIALMKDQVENLTSKGIPAVALHSGLSRDDTNQILNNALNGAYKLLYLSPERFTTQNFKGYLPNLNISLLVIDEFDPHEPFDTPEPWASQYRQDDNDPWLIWPPYVVNGVSDGFLTEQEGRVLRSAYGSKLSMIDHWLGKVLDALDATNGWDDTAVILCTDHGHYLGDLDVYGRDVWGKPGLPVYKPLGHIPMLVSWPGIAPSTNDALTTSTDIHATIAEIFGTTIKHTAHGSSLVPLLNGTSTEVREWLLTGVWGREVQLVTNEWRYTRGPQGINMPQTMWSNRWSTMPIGSMPDFKMPMPDSRAVLDYMPGSTVPVIRQPFREGDMLPFWGYAKQYETMMFHRGEDPDETVNRIDDSIAKDAEELLRVALHQVNAPSEQFERLSLT